VSIGSLRKRYIQYFGEGLGHECLSGTCGSTEDQQKRPTRDEWVKSEEGILGTRPSMTAACQVILQLRPQLSGFGFREGGGVAAFGSPRDVIGMEGEDRRTS
jgi:hypothetical protein